jgi:hypothetical protein
MKVKIPGSLSVIFHHMRKINTRRNEFNSYVIDWEQKIYTYSKSLCSKSLGDSWKWQYI